MTRYLTIFTAWLGLLTLVSAQTNILENGTNQLVTADWDLGGQELTVGGTTGSNILDINGVFAVTNVSEITVGRDASANENSMLVDGAGVFTTGTLKIGDAGSGNSLELTNGAYVENTDAWVGAQAGSNSNRIEVSTDSEWNNQGTLTITDGLSNAVTVSDSGIIITEDLAVNSANAFNLNDGGTLVLKSSFDVSTGGFHWNEGGHFSMTNGTLTGLTETNGSAILTGGRDLSLDDSTLDLSGSDLTVGYESGSSVLVLENGSSLISENGKIGSGANLDRSVVYLTGAGTSWRNNGGALDIGVDAGEGNQLIVDSEAWSFVGDVTEADLPGATTNGGVAVASGSGATLVADNGAEVSIAGGLFVGATNGMTGTVTVQSNSVLETGTLTIEDGSMFKLLETGSLAVEGDFDYADDTAKFAWEDQTTLTVGGTLSKTNGLDGTQRSLVLDGGSWSLSKTNVLAGVSNRLVVAVNGGLSTANGVVSGTNNTVSVQGSGAHWQNSGALELTQTSNSVAITSGGKISTGSVQVDDGNTLDIGLGGTLAITSDLDWASTSNVNWNSYGNLAIEGGTLTGMDSVDLAFDGITTSAVYLGSARYLTLNSGNWLNGNTNLVVGYNTSEASLAITNGSKVVNADGYIGWGNTATENNVFVSGTNSVWENEGGNLYVGAYWNNGVLTKAGSANRLTLSEHAQVIVGEATNTIPGMLVASTNHAEFTVWGGAAVIDDTLTLGLSSNSTGSAIVKDGGYLSVGDLVIADTNSVLDLQGGGYFDIRTNFNVAAREAAGFNWGSNSTLSVGGTLTGMTNALGKGHNLTLDGPNAVWDVAGPNLEIGLDSRSVLSLLNGASLTNVNTIIGASTNVGSHAIVMESGSYWKSTGDLMIGPYTSGNSLQIYSGSTNDLDGSAYIGATNASGNLARIEGSNSFWNIGGHLEVGATGSVNNVLQVYDQGQVTVASNLTVHTDNGLLLAADGGIDVFGDFILQSNATLTGSGTITLADADSALRLMNGNTASLDSGYAVVFQGTGSNTVDVDGGYFVVSGINSNQYRGFQTLEMEDTILFGYGTNNAFDVVSMTNGSIRPSAQFTRDLFGTLVVNGKFSSSNTTYYAQVLGDEGHDLLYFANGTNGANALDLGGLNADVVVGRVNAASTTILTSDAGFATTNFAEVSLVNNLLLYDAGLEVTANDVNVVITTNNNKFSSSLDYAGTEAVRSGFNGMQNAIFTRTKQLRRNLVSTAHAIPHQAFLMTNTNAPAGALGPGNENTIFDMHVWFQHFNGQGTFDQQGNSYGFDLSNNGTTFGADRLIGENLTLGLNYTYARNDARTTNDDTLDVETYWFGLYGEWVSQNGFYVDALAAYGRSNYESDRIENQGNRDYKGTASYRGNNLGGYLDLGQYYYYKKLSLSPYAGLHLLTMKSDEHTESEQNNGSQLEVEGQDRTIVESALGLKGRYRFDTGIGRFQTTGYAEWTHDFLNEDVYSTFTAVGFSGANLPPVDMASISPDADVINAGLGLSWICTDYLEIGVGYNGRFSDNYEEHSGSLMLDVMF